jgi:hypothetical protein
MKKLVLKPIFIVITLGIMSFFVFQSCNKENIPQESKVETSLQSNKVSKQICEIESKEDISLTVAQHITYYQASTNPFIYIPVSRREIFKQKFDSLMVVTNGMDGEQVLQYFQNKKMISSNVTKNLIALEQLIKTFDSQGTPVDITNSINSFETKIKNNLDLDCSEKDFILTITASFKGFFIYLKDTNRTLGT